MKFAITPAITTVVSERINFNAFCVYELVLPVHLLPSSALDMAPRWFLNKWGVLDFAGGAVVHISAGLSLAGAIYLGKRKFKHLKSYNTSYVLLGTGMLWFGWFGFNSGSALGANEDAILALQQRIQHQQYVVWLVMEGIKGHKIKVIVYWCSCRFGNYYPSSWLCSYKPKYVYGRYGCGFM